MKLNKFVVAAALAMSGMAAHGASIDSVSGYVDWKIAGVTTESSTWAGTDETTWGFGSVTSLTNGVSNIWQPGTEHLYYFIYGMADLQQLGIDTDFDTIPDSFHIFNNGATGGAADGKIHMDVYRSSSAIDIATATLASRTAFDTLSLFSGLELYLGLELVAGGVNDIAATTLVDESLTTMKQVVNSTTLPASGNGFFYAEAVAGTGKNKWDTNGFQSINPVADFHGIFSLQYNTTIGDAQFQSDFPGLVNDPIKSNAVPEPSTLALLGIGLLGASLVTRRRN